MIWLRRGMTVEGFHLDRWQASEVFFEARRIARSEGRMRRWPTVLLSLAAAVPILLILLPLLVMFMPVGATDFGGAVVLGAVIGIAARLIAGPASVLAFRWRHQRDLRRAMGKVGFPMCATCGYLLRDLGDDITKCPECGAKREKMLEVKS